MNGERQGKRADSPYPTREERKEQMAARQNGGSFRRQTISSPCVILSRTGKVSAETFIRWQRYAKSSIIPTDGSTTSVMRYSIPCIKANSTKCFPKAEVDRAMAQEAERLGNNLSEHWYSCFDIMRLFGLGKTQVRRFALTHGVRTKRIHGNRLYYLKADWGCGT